MRSDERTDKPAFGVYVHWPFCLSKCPYCDFNSHVRHAAIDEARFVRAFTAEIAGRHRLDPKGREEVAHFTQLARVMGRDHEPSGDGAMTL